MIDYNNITVVIFVRNNYCGYKTLMNMYYTFWIIFGTTLFFFFFDRSEMRSFFLGPFYFYFYYLIVFFFVLLQQYTFYTSMINIMYIQFQTIVLEPGVLV